MCIPYSKHTLLSIIVGPKNGLEIYPLTSPICAGTAETGTYKAVLIGEAAGFVTAKMELGIPDESSRYVHCIAVYELLWNDFE